SHKIQKLAPEAQETLTLAACVGSRFDLATLATVSRQGPDAAAARIDEAIAEGLVLRDGGDGGYVFLHDHVQHAAYARLPEESRASVHLRVGRSLRDSWSRAGDDDRIFDVAGHLNIGRALITDPDERASLARLNRAAGDRARGSTAYQAALDHFRTSVEL